jgi:hypothetical protein
LELVRIGDPLWPEFAAWRYGDQFGRRHSRALVRGTVVVAAAGTVLAGGVVVGTLAAASYWIYEKMVVPSPFWESTCREFASKWIPVWTAAGSWNCPT